MVNFDLSFVWRHFDSIIVVFEPKSKNSLWFEHAYIIYIYIPAFYKYWYTQIIISIIYNIIVETKIEKNIYSKHLSFFKVILFMINYKQL